jgi:hypothetical protein
MVEKLNLSMPHCCHLVLLLVLVLVHDKLGKRRGRSNHLHANKLTDQDQTMIGSSDPRPAMIASACPV